MNKRIRYFQKEPNTFVSVRTIKTHHGDMLVKYFGNNFLVLIYMANDPEVVVDTFTASSAHNMKKAIKAKLLEMGATFEPETRERGPNNAE